MRCTLPVVRVAVADRGRVQLTQRPGKGMQPASGAARKFVGVFRLRGERVEVETTGAVERLFGGADGCAGREE